MHEMSFWELVKNSPEWVGVFTSVVFTIVTIGVLVWQVLVMKWQGLNSERHERIQNRLIRLQHEHEWVLRKNQEREQLLKLGRQLHLAAVCLKEKPNGGDQLNWESVQDTAYELRKRLSILDMSTYSGAYDKWFFSLSDYVDAVLKAVIEDGTFDTTHDLNSLTPNLSTRTALKDADDRCKPINIFLDLETAIRMEFFEFREKWDAELRADPS